MTTQETRWSLERTQLKQRITFPEPEVPSTWGRFTRILEDAAGAVRPGERASLLQLARCGRLSIERVFRCGEEDQAVDAWCGHPWCPACANRTGAEAVRFVRDRWDERVIVVTIPVGVSNTTPLETLPSPASVASLRAYWGQIARRTAELTGLSQLERLPRVLLAPGRLLLFVRAPGSQRLQEQAYEAGIRRAAGEIGLRDVQARASSREVAAMTFREAFQAEATRFSEIVARDLGRLDRLEWRASFPNDVSLEAALHAMSRRWVQLLRHRKRTLRRQRVLGSKTALPAPEVRPPALTRPSCPTHGSVCELESTLVRDASRQNHIVGRFQGEAFSQAVSRQKIAALLDRTAPAPPELNIILPRSLHRLRKAG